ncbi:MAG TPA: chemotaxis response regulator protein-glutamate methylesterase [Bryobacteraceae bacterium]|nr:chemotaxis response regulator protein-glutamate methylesterase [Bryobacteraceae bacterium]
MTGVRKIGVLIVDDSAIVRKILSETLAAEDDIEVLATAPDPIVALEKIRRLKPDVLTLDLELPRMDGLTFLKALMESAPLPVIVVSSLAQSSCLAAMEALRSGAVDVLAKPSGPYSVGELRDGMGARIRAAAGAKLRRPAASPPPPATAGLAAPEHPPGYDDDALIAIGASTGGTEAIAAIFALLPAGMPPILIAQHIPPVFSATFAERLKRISRLDVREAADGDTLRAGLALVAPGGLHMLVERRAGRYAVRMKEGPLVQYQRPSVDVLFASVAEAAAGHAVGVLLTGMGRDGADGLLRMRRSGARTLAQDEVTSVVFGMPREAIKLGAAGRVLPLEGMAAGILNALATPSRAPDPSIEAPHRSV